MNIFFQDSKTKQPPLDVLLSGLRSLYHLKDEGVLTEEEYDNKQLALEVKLLQAMKEDGILTENEAMEKQRLLQRRRHMLEAPDENVEAWNKESDMLKSKDESDKGN